MTLLRPKLLKEPLIHFLILGIGLFGFFALVGDGDAGAHRSIAVTAAQVEALSDGFQRSRRRPPTQDELAALVEAHVSEEIYYREAVARGLGSADVVVRRRLRRLLELEIDVFADGAEASDEELARYYAENSERLGGLTRFSFEHVYFRDHGEEEAARALERLAGGDDVPDPATLGEPTQLPRSYRRARATDLARRFGEPFAVALSELPTGRWAGPIESRYGVHLVRLGERHETPAPPLAEVREAVEREWRAARREEARETFYRELRGRYTVTVEPLAQSPASR